jgi:hypothetical protein
LKNVVKDVVKDVTNNVVTPNMKLVCKTNAFTMEAVAASGCTTNFRTTLVDDSIGGIVGESMKVVVKNVVAPNTEVDCKTNAFTMEAVAASGCTTDFRTTLADDSIGGSAGESLKDEVKDIGIVITPNTKVCETLSIWMVHVSICTFTCIMIHLAITCPLTTCICDAGNNGTKGTDENKAYRTISTAVGKRPKKRKVTLVVRMKSDWKRWVLLLCLPLNVMGYDSVPNGDGSNSYDSAQSTGLRKVVSDWTAGGTLKDAVVAKYGEIENWETSEVTNLAYVFYNAKYFNADISEWVVSSVTTLQASKSFLPNCGYMYMYM